MSTVAFVQSQDNEEAEADAVLIAAAPVMLSVLEDFVSDHDNELGPDIDRLRNAIANARGDS